MPAASATSTTPSWSPWTGWSPTWSPRSRPGAVLVVTADHGQIDVGNRVEMLGREAMAMVRFLSGEGRFRWVHARPGPPPTSAPCSRSATAAPPGCAPATSSSTTAGSAARCADGFAGRLGDVALIPFEPIAFMDPADTGENRLACRHGSLTTDEMLVPLVALGGERL